MGSTWRAHIRVEKNGEAAEYNDTVTTRRRIPTVKEIEAEVVAAIIRHSPHLKGGRIAHSAIRRIR